MIWVFYSSGIKALTAEVRPIWHLIDKNHFVHF